MCASGEDSPVPVVIKLVIRHGDLLNMTISLIIHKVQKKHTHTHTIHYTHIHRKERKEREGVMM